MKENKVKLTIEVDGETITIEAEAAFIAAFDDKGDALNIHSMVAGYGTIGDTAQAIVDAVVDQDRSDNKGLLGSVAKRINAEIMSELLGIKAEED